METPIFEDKQLETLDCNLNRVCSCGVRAPMWTSWSEENPGRRFIGCPNYKDRAKHCHFFAWLDPPLPERSKKTFICGRMRSQIVELKHEVDKLEMQLKQVVEEAEKLKKKRAKLKVYERKLEEQLRKAKEREQWYLGVIFFSWTMVVGLIMAIFKGNTIGSNMLLP